MVEFYCLYQSTVLQRLTRINLGGHATEKKTTRKIAMQKEWDLPFLFREQIK